MNQIAVYRWLLACFTVLLNIVDLDGQTIKCFSCASENMKYNFENRKRGPPGRIRQPKVFDNMCDWDLWLLKEKAVVDCDGVCMKWQQQFNNSGVLSYATIRGCHKDMFRVPPEIKQSQLSHCRRSDTSLDLDNLDNSHINEDYCECTGDHCNSSYMLAASYLFGLVAFLSIFA